MEISILFNFFLLFCSLTCIAQKLYGECEYCAYQTTALLLGIFLFWFEAAYELPLVSYATKLSLSMQDALVWQLLWLLFTSSGCGMYSQATPGLLNSSVLGYDEFAMNYSNCVRPVSRILKTWLPGDSMLKLHPLLMTTPIALCIKFYETPKIINQITNLRFQFCLDVFKGKVYILGKKVSVILDFK